MVLVPSACTDEKKIFDFGQSYLANKTFETETLTAKECNFCHIEVAPDAIVDTIIQQGYVIIEMENCN